MLLDKVYEDPFLSLGVTHKGVRTEEPIFLNNKQILLLLLLLGPKTNYLLNMNNFLTTIPILGLKVLLDGGHLDLNVNKYYLFFYL